MSDCDLKTPSQPAAQLRNDTLVERNRDTDLRTAPFDSRFPTQNQMTYCFQSFCDYQRCKKIKGEDYLPCEYFKRCYRSMCPNHIRERYEEALAEDRFPATF